VDVDLAPAKPHLLVDNAGSMIKCIRRRLSVEKDGNGVVRWGAGKGLAFRTAEISVAVRSATPTGFPIFLCSRFSSSAFIRTAEASDSKTTFPLAI